MWRICHWVVSKGLLMGGYLRTLLLTLGRRRTKHENAGNEIEKLAQVEESLSDLHIWCSKYVHAFSFG
jgi:hypothetical protein